jgi:hypothetical protein
MHHQLDMGGALYSMMGYLMYRSVGNSSEGINSMPAVLAPTATAFRNSTIKSFRDIHDENKACDKQSSRSSLMLAISRNGFCLDQVRNAFATTSDYDVAATAATALVLR